MRSVLFKPEGKSIVQHSAFILPRVMSGKRSSGGNACNEDVDGRSVRCKTTCTYFPLKKQTGLTYAKPRDPWQGFLRCILLTIALYLGYLHRAQQTNLYRYFAYHVMQFHGAMKTEIQMGKSQMTQPPCSSVNSTESGKSSGLKRAARLLWRRHLLSLHEQKDVFAKECCMTSMWTGSPTVAVGIQKSQLPVCEQHVADV